MRESEFIEQNKSDWKRLELLLEESKTDPNVLHDLFIKVSGDLSYARSHYPNRRVRLYLNGLINALFDRMRIRKKIKFRSLLVRYYTEILPNEIIRNRAAFLLSAFVFLVAILIGIYSSYTDYEFLRLILGDDYVNMTLENINAGDPMAVYKFENASLGFLKITVNNIRVAFLAFGLGLLFGLGTIFVLIRNGIMLGAFQSFFAIKGLFWTSFLTIWIHGTLEISSIVIAGASGLILGRSLAFPGTYTRKDALSRGAISALIIMLSTVPLFIIAGFLEGFVTRLTDLPTFAKALILGISAFIILGIYVIYPILYYRRGAYDKNRMLKERDYPILSFPGKRTLLERVSQQYIEKIEPLFQQVILPLWMLISTMFFVDLRLRDQQMSDSEFLHFELGEVLLSPLGIALFLGLCAYLVTQTIAVLSLKRASAFSGLRVLYRQPLALVLIISLIYLGVLYHDSFFILGLIFVPVMGLFRILESSFHPKEMKAQGFLEIITQGNQLFSSVVGWKIAVVLILFLVSVLLNSFFNFILVDFLNWHPLFDHSIYQRKFWSLVLNSFVLLVLYPYVYLLLSQQLNNQIKEHQCVDLFERLAHFQKKNQ